MKLSIIISFYKGNQYLDRLFRSIENVKKKVEAQMEVIIVNDSPFVDVILPKSAVEETTIINNEVNVGIQGARIKGYEKSSGEWLLFLDQDDELVADGFKKQMDLTKESDVVVGNGRYILGSVDKQIFRNLKVMEYLIQERRFIEIRNVIPSPGECLIKKDVIPRLWIENRLKHNGADDWLLWILLFKSGAKFSCNDKSVYIHNDAGGENLSSDLKKMRESSIEMANVLHENFVLSPNEINRLFHSIEFKYYQDTKHLSLKKLYMYKDALWSNIKYRLTLNTLEH